MPALRNYFRFYYYVLGGHTHVRFFAGDGKAGDFILTNDEFVMFQGQFRNTLVQFINEGEEEPT